MKHLSIYTCLCLLLIVVPGCRKGEGPSLASGAQTGISALPHTKQYAAGLAHRWFRLMADVSRTTPLVPAPSVRLFAYTGLAFYEAVVPGMPSYQSMFTHLTGEVIEVDKKKDYHWGIAGNTAVAEVARRIMRNYSANPNLTAINQMEQDNLAMFSASVSAEQLEQSRAFGLLVADKIYAWSTTDGTLTSAGTLAPCPPYVPVGGPGNWVPTPPAFSPAAGACQGSLRTFVPGIALATRPAPPPAYSTDPASPFYQAAADVITKTAARTPDDALLCQSWRDLVGTNYNTPSHVLRITTDILADEPMDLEQAAALYAKQGMAMFDAVVSAFNAKFHYSLLRPITYIRGVMMNAAWNPLYITIIHPSYPSTMPCAAAAGFQVVATAIGQERSFEDRSLENLYGVRSYKGFDAVIADVGRTRVLSGHNFQFAVDAGINQGLQVADAVNALPFRK